jgi:hypothetical protein
MRDDYDPSWAQWAPIPISPTAPDPYVCALCGVLVRSPADTAHDFTKHTQAA